MLTFNSIMIWKKTITTGDAPATPLLNEIIESLPSFSK